MPQDTWNETAVKAAWDERTAEEDKGVAVYAASKAEGERQSWKWVEQHQPRFVFNTVLPCFNVRVPNFFHERVVADLNRLEESFTQKSPARQWVGFASYYKVIIQRSQGSLSVRS